MTDDPQAAKLGGFLKARRMELRPDEVGLPSTGRRRVKGLRREEVALLAAISTDYYARIEQGRRHAPRASAARDRRRPAARSRRASVCI